MKAIFARLVLAAIVLSVSLGTAHPQSLPDLVEKIRPSIGLVRVRAGGQSGSATAFAVHPEGYLLTALHVVLTAAEIQVSLAGQTDNAEVVGIDKTNDIALLRVPRTGLTPLPLTATSPRTGEEIVVVGFPLTDVLGGQDVVVTRGIISALHQSLPELSQHGLSITGPVIQVDAAMNPGVSGGPVLTLRGEVVGVAVSGLRPAANVNFALSSATAQALLTRALPDGGGSRPPALPLPLARTQSMELSYKSRSGLTVNPKERILEAACSSPPRQAFAWVRYEGRMTLGVSPDQAARMGVGVWLSTPGGAPLEADASFGLLFIVGPVFHSNSRSSDTWSRPAGKLCLNYEVNSGGFVAGYLFEARYTLEFLAWTGD